MTATSESTAERTAEGVAVRLPESEWRASYDLFLECLHLPPASDERWDGMRGLYRPGRVYGIRAEGEVVATVMSTPLQMALPGGAVVPVAGSTAVGVRSGHTRRGLHTTLMRTRLNDLADSGEVFQVDRPSAGTLYTRWGSGPATFTRTYRVLRDRTGPRPDLAAPRHVRRLPIDGDLTAALAAVYSRVAASGGRPGAVSRPAAWWAGWNPYANASPTLAAAVHDGPEGVGYATWHVEFEGVDVASMRRVLTVHELVAESPEVAGALWRYLLRLDLVEEIRAPGRPVDEPLALLLTDPRGCRTEEMLDELWLRIVDVPAALAARRWEPAAGSGTGSGAVVVEVRDEQLPANDGRYRISGDGVERVATEPDLTMPVSALGSAYLGGVAPTQLAAAGLVAVHDRARLPTADRLFATTTAPWCGTMF